MSKIEWCDATWNPIAGCSDVSEGCRNCYARTMAKRLGAMRKEKYDGLTARQGSKTVWTGKISFDEKALLAPLKRKKPTRYFVNSMSDLFHPNVTDEQIDRVFAVMAIATHHTFLVLTKRPERMREYLWNEDRCEVGRIQSRIQHQSDVICGGGSDISAPLPKGFYAATDGTVSPHTDWPLPNLWLGVSVEDQATADERIPLLLQTPAAIRFVSYEPALGPVDFNKVRAKEDPGWFSTCLTAQDIYWSYAGEISDGPDHGALDWIIVGGESGPGARGFNVEWALSTVEQCAAASVACFVKQLGAKPFDTADRFAQYPGAGIIHEANEPDAYFEPLLSSRKGSDMSEWPEDLRVRQFPGAQV